LDSLGRATAWIASYGRSRGLQSKGSADALSISPKRCQQAEPEPDPIEADGINWKPRNLFPIFGANVLLKVEYSGQDRHTLIQPHEDIQMPKAKKPAAKKVSSSTAAAKPKGPGVIETIIATISRERGATADEVLEILKGKFPDRDPDGMRRTIGIQAPKNCTSKDDDQKRGRVFYKRR
jgi:hypothetical protein